MELKTRTKMFCDSLNDPDESRPNVNVCPVCLGHPGALPTINKEAVRDVIAAGLAMGGKINPVTKFDRKNYFYPDLPKGYQISQYDEPLVIGGSLSGIKITRIHLEEDAGKLIHPSDGKSTYVDFNRAGVPLMELVTEPVIGSAAEAVMFAKELQLLLRYIGISDADLERGQMRVDANISVSATDELGIRAEIKNLNSWDALKSAIEFEISRQTEVLRKGEEVRQETRGWDMIKRVTKSQRSKEHAHDYRYFPEPDLPPIETKIFDLESIAKNLPELPEAKRLRFMGEFGLSEDQARLLSEEKWRADYFEAAISELATRDELSTSSIEKKPRELLYNYFMSDLSGLMNEFSIGHESNKITPSAMAHLVDLISDGKIMSRQAKDILRKMFIDGSDPEEILELEGLHTISDEKELGKIVLEIIEENKQAALDFINGKEASVQFMIGRAMSKLKGRGNPSVLKELFARELNSKKHGFLSDKPEI